MSNREATHTDQLLTLSRTEFSNDLRGSEIRTLRNSCKPGSGEPSKCTLPARLTPGTEVRPIFLRWLLTDAEANRLLDSDGFQLAGVYVSGLLDLDDCKITFDVTIENCYFDGTLSLNYAAIQSLDISGSYIKGMIQGSNVTISGDLDIVRTRLTQGLILDHSRISGYTNLAPQFISDGPVSMLGSRVGSNVLLPGAIVSPGGLILDRAVIEGDVVLDTQKSENGSERPFVAPEGVRLTGTQVGGDVRVQGASISHLFCEGAKISGRLCWAAIKSPNRVTLNLTGANVGVLVDERGSWPQTDNLFVNDLIYRDLKLLSRAPSLEETSNSTLPQISRFVVDDRIEWLLRQPSDERAFASPWMQLSALCLAKGDAEGSKKVLYTLSEYKLRGDGCLVERGASQSIVWTETLF